MEEAGGGTGRSRPWRLTSIGMSFAPGDTEAQIASDAVLGMLRERQFARYDQWRSSKGSFPRAWQDAAINSEYLFYLTAEELQQLSDEMHELLTRWVLLENRLENPSRRPAGALPAETLLLAHPIAPPTPENDETHPEGH